MITPPPIGQAPHTSFRTRVGRIKDRGSGTLAKSHVGSVVKTLSQLGRGGQTHAPKSTKPVGKRFGRGAGHGALFASQFGRRPGAWRRVVVKMRIVKLARGGLAAAGRHLSYLQRDGVARARPDELTPDTANERGQGLLYDANGTIPDGRAILERSSADRHQFRLIVAPEDGVALGDLQPFVRDLMSQMETDLDTKLDWVAVDHHNTGRPHSHIVIRGKTDKGDDLVIARDYISHGIRHRASDLATCELGPQTAREIEHKLSRQLDLEAYTDIDRQIAKSLSPERVFDTNARSPDTAFVHALKLGRLHRLEQMGLANQLKHQSWQLAANWDQTLKRMADRHDTIKTLHAALKSAGLDPGSTIAQITDPANPAFKAIKGKVLDKGLHDEFRNKPYLLLGSADGRVHYVPLKTMREVDGVCIGDTIRIQSQNIAARTVEIAIEQNLQAEFSINKALDINL